MLCISVSHVIHNMKHVRKIRSPIFLHIENMFIGDDCYVDGKAGLPAIFNEITVAIDALLHALWHFSYTLVIELSHHVAQVQGSICTARELSNTDLQAFLAPLLQLFWLKPMAEQNAVRHGRLYVRT